tara:strand:+ start:880 stop:1248 length:369 start_codon:yes stop_codon:yes gene_type:complete
MFVYRVDQRAHRDDPSRHVERGILLYPAFGLLDPIDGGNSIDYAAGSAGHLDEDVGEMVARIVGVARFGQRSANAHRQDESRGGRSTILERSPKLDPAYAISPLRALIKAIEFHATVASKRT